MKVLSSNPLVVVWLVMAVLCTVGLMQRVEGQSGRVGQCLIGCSGSSMSCAIDCGISRGGGGTLACYQGCATEDISCLISCFGRQVLPKSKCD